MSDLDVVVVGGCGHVGLPLALSFCNAGLRVGIYDMDHEKVEKVRSGLMPFVEKGADLLLADALARGLLKLDSDSWIVEEAAVVIVVVGTPVDEFLQPKLTTIEDVIESIIPDIREDAVLVLRSTVFPGTTERVAERWPDLDVVYAPERVVQGRAIEDLRTLPQIIGADGERAWERAADLFHSLGVKCVFTRPREAEFAKLIANAWRYLKFAAANEFLRIVKDADVDYDAVLNAVRHDYPRAEDLPGPGFAAGPCLLKDTMQLAAVDSFPLGEAARIVNEGLPREMVGWLGDIRGKRVAVLGMAFKQESDDVRDSLSFKLVKLLKFAGAEVVTHDPYVEGLNKPRELASLFPFDVVIVGVPHPEYRGLDCGDARVIDVWGVIDGRIKC